MDEEGKEIAKIKEKEVHIPYLIDGTVIRILENSKYLGDELYPPLIDEATFQKVQELRKSNKKKVSKKSKEDIEISYLIKPKTIYLPKEIRLMDSEIMVNPSCDLIFKRAEMLYNQSKIYDIS